MKKILICALAVGMFTACSQEETLSTQAPTQISFAGAFVENATRVAVDPSTTTASITAFDVWGFMDQPSGIVFNREKVTGSQTDGWSYANTQYWTPKHTYYFAALAPAASNNIKVDIAFANANGLGVITFDNIDGTEDLLYSAVKYDALANLEQITSQPDPVKFTFNHMLSKVKFTFKNTFANNNASLKITEIKMTAPSGAQINVAQADWWSTNQWQIPEGCENGRTLEFGDLESNNLAAGASFESANERLTIPANETQEYTVTFHVQLYQGDVMAIEADRTVTIKGVALEIGKAYNFVAELNADNITDNPLYPIEFEVIEVKDWDYTPGDIAAAQHCDTEAELTAAIEKGGEVILDGNITLSSTLNVTKNTILNLNGKTLTNQVNNTNTDVIVVGADATLIINGEGAVAAVTGNDGYAIISDGTLVINGGTYTSGVDENGEANAVIYARANGKVYVNGGTFPNDVPSKFVLNKKDADRATTVISVTGGTFTNFNPANNAAEGAGTDFVAPGYESVETAAGSNIWKVQAIGAE